MTTQRQHVWRDGWTAGEPAEIGFAWAAADGGAYADLRGDGLLYRDLGLEQASGGALGVQRVRVGDAAAASQWRTLDVDFDFLYVLAGSANVENEDGDTASFGTGGCAVHPGGMRYRLTDLSPDFEAVHVTAPASFELTLGESGGGRASEPAVYTHELPENYVKGNGPRAYFSYRDLGTRGPTDGRIHFHIVRASEAGPGTGWHYHSMAQWFMVIGGSAVIRVEDRPHQPLKPLDAMCVGRGPRMRHNVTKFSADYAVLEMCIPAEYETTAVDEPEGADSD
jgi:hypothetical protein